MGREAETEAAARAPDAPERPGAIILARHAAPALSRKVRLSADDYRRWWASYEEGGLLAGQTVPAGLTSTARKAAFVIASTRRRSAETARLITERDFAQDPLLIEAPLPPPHLPSFVRLSPRTWGFLARCRWWFLDRHDGEESRTIAKARAEEAARQLTTLADGGGDVLVIGHWFFNAMIARVLKKLGWRCVADEGYRYWSARRFERAPSR
jgi:broad specificity phosphatase PhoE